MLRVLVAVFIVNFHFLVVFGQDVSSNIYPLDTSAPQIDSTAFFFSESPDEDIVNYFRDPRIDNILRIQKDINKRKAGIPGFKVQLFRGNSQKLSKARALEIQALVYQKMGKSTEVDVIFTTPYWRVQVGNFRLQNEAMKEEARFKSAFPDLAESISVIPSTINVPTFKSKNIKE